jgi:TolB-like protein/Tfp pilus assembly protein PilF
VGVVLYEMLTGRRPFAGEYEQAMMYAIANTKQQSVSELRPDVPSSLEKIINRCLEKVADVRVQGAQMLADALRKLELNGAEPGPTPAPAKSIAVLPFADISPEQDNKYFSDGLTEEIITNLSKLRTVRIISRTSVMHYERTGKPLRQIADELGVQYLLEGSVRKHRSDLRITTQLLDAKEDTYLWAENYSGTVDQVFEIQENVAARIVRALKVRLTPGEKRNLNRRHTENTEAYQLYLKGRFFWNKRSQDGLRKSIRYFEEAIALDARYALAWAGIADSYNLLTEYGPASRKEMYAKARAAVEKALELDDRLAEAHTSLAFLIMLNELDWPNSEKEFKRAIKLKPNYPTAHHWYAQWLMFNGKTEQAIGEISKAAGLDPFSPAIVKDKGLTLYYARQYDGAIECAIKALEMDPGFAVAHRLLSLAYQEKRLFTQAIESNGRWGEQGGNEVEAAIGLAQIYAAAGRKSDAMAQMETVSPEKLSSGNILRGVALIYAALGENDLAFAWLEKSYANRAESLCTLKVDPKMDKLRADPRFVSLLRRVGLEK